jgi:AraC-like DNA-binding protein
MQLGSPARWDSIAGLEAAAPGGLHLVDQTSAYDYRFNGNGGSVAVIFDYSRIGLPIDEARKAIPHLTNSPIYQLFREDLSNVCDALDDASDATVTDNIASSLQSLAKALVMTAAGGAELELHESDESHEVLCRRILHFVHSHLGEHTLGEASVARRLNVSVKSIRAAWPNEEPPLPEYLQRIRLERVRSDLESPKSKAGSNGSMWRRWGFLYARALRTQFRQHFGMSVDEWGRSEFEALDKGTEESPSRHPGE